MGRGRNKQNNYFKKQYLSQAVKYIEKLEAENKALKEDPNTVIGQFIGQYRELYSQNSRLSVLAASLIKKLDGKVVLTKEELEQFKGNRINIKWELPDGVEKVEDATEYTFSYELQAEPEPQPQQVTATEQPGLCEDPECELTQKGLNHRHTAAPTIEVNEGDQVVVDGNLEAQVVPGATTDGGALSTPAELSDEEIEAIAAMGSDNSE